MFTVFQGLTESHLIQSVILQAESSCRELLFSFGSNYISLNWTFISHFFLMSCIYIFNNASF